MTGLAAFLENRRHVFAERHRTRAVCFAIFRRLRAAQDHQRANQNAIAEL
jgi:hypothetical protein